MTIWRGIEQEGKHVGELTYFVESNMLTKRIVEIICEHVPKGSRLYIGAGRQDIEFIHDYEEIVSIFEKQNYTITWEQSFSNSGMCILYQFPNCEYVFTMRYLNIPKNVSFKTDNYKELNMYEQVTMHRDIQDVCNNRYNNIDEIIYQG